MSILLAVTAWETFIEDALSASVRSRLDNAESPADVSSTFNAVAESWLMGGAKKPPDLATWAGDGWKQMILSRFDEELAKLNAPNVTNLRHLSTRYLSTDITRTWTWKGTSSNKACARLDDLVRLRGQIAHRTKDWFEVFGKVLVRRKHVTEAVALLGRLVDCTEKAFGRAPTSHKTS